MIKIPNGRIACEPRTNSIEKETKSGFATVKQKTTLLATTVVYSNEDENDYQVGDTVYLDGNDFTMPWFRLAYNLGGRSVILVPVDRIVATESKRPATSIDGVRVERLG